MCNYEIKDILKILNDKKKDIKTKNERDLNTICKLPYLITNSSDFFVASILISKPNFITDNKVISKNFPFKKRTKYQSNKR